MNHAEDTGTAPDGLLAKSYFVKRSYRIVSSFPHPSGERGRMGRLHEIIIAPILFFLKPVFVKHPLVTPRFLFFFPDFLLFLFFLLLHGQRRSSYAVAGYLFPATNRGYGRGKE